MEIYADSQWTACGRLEKKRLRSTAAPWSTQTFSGKAKEESAKKTERQPVGQVAEQRAASWRAGEEGVSIGQLGQVPLRLGNMQTEADN